MISISGKVSVQIVHIFIRINKKRLSRYFLFRDCDPPSINKSKQ